MSSARLRLALCAAIVLLGAVVMGGWFLDVEPVKSVAPGFSAMKFNSAICFVVAGVGLALAPAPASTARRVAVACGGFIAVVGALTLLEYVGGWDFGIDQLIVRDTGLRGMGVPGRMSPLTASSWLTLGLAVIGLATGRSRFWLRAAHSLSGLPGIVSFFDAAGYAFGAHAFWGSGQFTLMAVHTAVGLMVCVCVVLMTRAHEGWLSGLEDAPGARATLLEFVPISIFLPFGVGLLLLFGSGLGAYNAAFGFAMFAPLITVGMLTVGFRVAWRAREGEIALRRSESRAREQLEELEAIYESSPVGLAFLTPDLKFVRVNRRLAEMNGLPAAAHLGRTSGEVVPDLSDQIGRIAQQVRAGESMVQYETSGETPAAPGVRRYWLGYWVPLRSESGAIRGLNVVVEEITERKLAESRRKLLIDELNHRVRNTLAVVQAIARRTFAGGQASAGAREAFEERLHALASAHAILTRENWRSADLREIVQTAAGVQGAGRLFAAGPPVALKPSMAVSLSLALHELATNAAKYGALSVPQGEVLVNWTAEGGRLGIRWQERGGPAVETPRRGGFRTPITGL